MKNLKKISALFLFSFLLSPLAYGDFFKCGFTEPFFNVYVSTSANFVTLNVFSEENASKKLDIIKSSDKDGVLTLTLSDQQELKINWNTPGGDGVPDLNFPYEGTLGDLYGGCSRETNYVEFYQGKIYDQYTLERWKSWESFAGASFSHDWLGEGARLSKYEVTKEITLPMGSTWASIENSRKDKLACTLPKGKVISPEAKKSNEVFGTLGSSILAVANAKQTKLDIAAGDTVTLVAQQGEGFCLVEKDGKMDSLDCLGNFTPVENEVFSEGHDVPPNGYWVFTLCKEGHYTWIPAITMDKEGDSFKYSSGF